MKMSISLDVLKVLLWKHAMVRLRRFIHTFVDVLSPLSIFIILFFVRMYLIAPVPVSDFDKATKYNEIVTEPVALESVRRLVGRVLYAPDARLSRELASAVADRLDLAAASTTGGRGYTEFPTEAALDEFVASAPKGELVDCLALVFHNLDGEIWPPHLNYTIKANVPPVTSGFVVDKEGSHEYLGVIYYEFMALQWAVDSTYLQKLTDEPVTQSVWLQEFPSVTMRKVRDMTGLLTALTTCTWLAPMLSTIFLISRLIEERSSGIQELMKMMGVTSDELGLAHFINTLPSCLSFATGSLIIFKASSTCMFPESNSLFLALFLFIYFVNMVAVGFCCSYVVTSSSHTISMAVFVYILLSVPPELVPHDAGRPMLSALAALVPHVGVLYLWEELCYLESQGMGLSFGNAWRRRSAPCSAGVALLMMCAQALLLFALAWYLERVRPGKFGRPLPWTFIFQEEYWRGKRVSPEAPEAMGLESESRPEMCGEHACFIEAAPAHATPAIRLRNVSKVYSSRHGVKTVALDNVTFDIYKGEITILVGHNGAGKTTLMSIITGMSAASRGSVLVEDRPADAAALRGRLGLCPQHNLFFPDLTVIEHLIFFAMLKGSNYREAKKQSLELLVLLKLKEKKCRKGEQLSGGMKRRLQLACALAGGAPLLVLDEPTAGLDVETRRELWDTLLSLRGARTVLMTTHMMEEADVLGDRVAALHAGQLCAHATPMFLKKAVGTGYRMSLTVTEDADEDAVAHAIRSVVPDAKLRERTPTSLTYGLPAEYSASFPGLFDMLEKNKSRLGISAIGVGVSTLEEVFLRLCSNDVYATTEDAENGHAAEESTDMSSRVQGVRLRMQQYAALLKRQFHYTMSKKYVYAIFHVLLPLVCVALWTALLAHEARSPERGGVMDSKAAVLSLGLYEELAPPVVLYAGEGASPTLMALAAKWPHARFQLTENVTRDVLEAGHADTDLYRHLVLGIELNATAARVHYSTAVRHAGPVALAMLADALAVRARVPANITTRAAPLQPRAVPGTRTLVAVDAKPLVALYSWALFFMLVMIASLHNNTGLLTQERELSTRHLHVLAGCPLALHWAVALSYHLVCFAALVLLPALTATALLERDHTLDRAHFLVQLWLLMCVGGAAVLAFAYTVSCVLSARASNVLLLSVLLIFGVVTPSLLIGLEATQNAAGPRSAGVRAAVVLCHLVPAHSLTSAVYRAMRVARLNALCDLNQLLCPRVPALDDGFDVAACCGAQAASSWFGPHSYLNTDHGYGHILAILSVQLLTYFSLVLMIEQGLFTKPKEASVQKIFGSPPLHYSDKMATKERDYVRKAINTPESQITDALLVHELRKCYWNVISKPCHAVRGVSFSVKRGECFGLLGVNGAGKSSTFRMLAGECRATAGCAVAAAQTLSALHRRAYLDALGYCPQFNALDPFLSGGANLRLLLLLRGLPPATAARHALVWMRRVGLEELRGRDLSAYSGGCARRLAAAAALCTGAPLVLLDEPTAGVDPAARYRLWAVLRVALVQHRSLLITSHSMDEMEQLCGRIAIMAGGELCALGSAAELRAAHAQGHTLTLKLRPVSAVATRDCPDNAETEVARLKASLVRELDCHLKEEHESVLSYHLPPASGGAYSVMFGALERLRAEHAVLEDYSLNETTLEEVFLAFARDAARPCTLPVAAASDPL